LRNALWFWFSCNWNSCIFNAAILVLLIPFCKANAAKQMDLRSEQGERPPYPVFNGKDVFILPTSETFKMDAFNKINTTSLIHHAEPVICYPRKIFVSIKSR